MPLEQLVNRPQKITLGEMRAMGVRGLLVYCSDFRCSHSIAINADRWPIMCGCRIWRRISFVRLVVIAGISGQISTGDERARRHGFDHQITRAVMSLGSSNAPPHSLLASRRD